MHSLITALLRALRQPATLLAIGAVALAAGGTATAASLIKSKQIANNTIQSVDVKNRTLTDADVKRGSLSAAALSSSARNALKGATGPQGPAGAQGAQGAKGDKGDKGETGPSNGYFARIPVSVNAPNTESMVDTLDLPAGKYLINAQVHAVSVGAGAHTIECALNNGDDVLGEAMDIYEGGGERGNFTIVASADLDGLQLNSNDVTLDCTDNDTGVLIRTNMTAVKVATLEGA